MVSLYGWRVSLLKETQFFPLSKLYSTLTSFSLSLSLSLSLSVCVCLAPLPFPGILVAKSISLVSTLTTSLSPSVYSASFVSHFKRGSSYLGVNPCSPIYIKISVIILFAEVNMCSTWVSHGKDGDPRTLSHWPSGCSGRWRESAGQVYVLC